MGLLWGTGGCMLIRAPMPDLSSGSGWRIICKVWQTGRRSLRKLSGQAAGASWPASGTTSESSSLSSNRGFVARRSPWNTPESERRLPLMRTANGGWPWHSYWPDITGVCPTSRSLDPAFLLT